MENVKFIHNETGKETDCYCEDVKSELINDESYFICSVGEKTVAAFPFKYFAMCSSKEYIKSKSKFQ